MSNIPEELHYSEEHEYVTVAEGEGDGVVLIGITDYAQGELGDIVYVDLPAVGSSFAQMEVFGTIEAVKAVSELFCPIAGEIVAVNEELDGNPNLVNQDPYGEGWMIKMRPTNPDQVNQLLTAADYAQHIGE
ncbi:MAG: glycine cleavage system protein GcvH [Gemmatimonadales bacterium]